MSHGHTRIPSKGQCIYCYKKSKLGDEHIVPYFLAGNSGHIIIEASCTECAKITSKFERDIAQGLWGDARISSNAPSRRKKNKPSHLNLIDIPNVSYNSYPAPWVFYKMHTAGLLMGYNQDCDTSKSWTFSAIVDEEKLQKFEKENPGKLTAKLRFNHDSYARFIIKIGYCQILTSLDIDDFRPICLPYILGKKGNHSFILGSNKEPEPPVADIGYILSSMNFGTDYYMLLIATVRLLADNYTPAYHVVVGDVSGMDNVSYVRNKMQATCDVIVQDDKPRTWNHPLNFHWMPQKWPLPKI